MLASLEDSSQLEARRQCVPGEGGEGAMIDGSGVTSLVTACAYPVLTPPPLHSIPSGRSHPCLPVTRKMSFAVLAPFAY